MVRLEPVGCLRLSRVITCDFGNQQPSTLLSRLRSTKQELYSQAGAFATARGAQPIRRSCLRTASGGSRSSLESGSVERTTNGAGPRKDFQVEEVNWR